MPFKRIGFESDNIEGLIGFDGSRTEQCDYIIKWFEEHSAVFPCRAAFAINQYCPEVEGSGYLNKALIALIQEGLEAIGLHVVEDGNYLENDVVHEEYPGCIEFNSDYLLVDPSLRKQGKLRAWESHGGWGNFYPDNYIIEIMSSEQQIADLMKTLERKCKEESVTFSFIDAPLKTPIKPGGWTCIKRKILG